MKRAWSEDKEGKGFEGLEGERRVRSLTAAPRSNSCLYSSDQ